MCNTSADCEPRLAFSGCFPLQDCVAPTMPGKGGMLDFSGCGSVQPGSSCYVSCSAPYLIAADLPPSVTFLASCPFGNEPLWACAQAAGDLAWAVHRESSE